MALTFASLEVVTSYGSVVRDVTVSVHKILLLDFPILVTLAASEYPHLVTPACISTVRVRFDPLLLFLDNLYPTARPDP